MPENFFKKYYPDVEYLDCTTRAQKFVELIDQQNLFLELGVAWGGNIKNFQQAGWSGRIIGLDLWKRFDKPTDLGDVLLVEGDVRDTLPAVLESVDTISLLSIDLDGDVDASIASLDMCRDKLNGSYIYLDEFYGFDNWQNGLANSVATWLALNLESYDVAFYTNNGLAIKVGGAYTADNLMLNLLEYTTEQM